MSKKLGSKNAEYLRISLALRDIELLKKSGVSYPGLLEKATEYLEERKIKVTSFMRPKQT